MFDESRNPPVHGLVDWVIRRFRMFAWVTCCLVLYMIAASAVGFALTPGLWVGTNLSSLGADSGPAGRMLWLAMGISAGAFVTGGALIIVVPIYNLFLPTRLKPFKGGFYTIASLPWFIHNALFYLVRFTVLPFITLTPFGLWFLSAMGMKIGKRAFVNTECISDACLISLGKDVVVGGSVTLFAHYGGAGHLNLSPVEIGDRATIGIKATIMGDVIVGADAVIMPHTVLLPGTRVGPGETWAGVPGRPVSKEELEQHRQIARGQSGVQLQGQCAPEASDQTSQTAQTAQG